MLRDVTQKQMKNLQQETKNKAKNNEKLGKDAENFLHIFYHSGHGVESNSVAMALNAFKVEERYFNIEADWSTIS